MYTGILSIVSQLTSHPYQYTVITVADLRGGGGGGGGSGGGGGQEVLK